MTRDELWAAFVAKNPTFATNDDTRITMTTRGLRKLFDQTFDKGFERGLEVAKETENVFSKFFGR